MSIIKHSRFFFIILVLILFSFSSFRNSLSVFGSPLTDFTTSNSMEILSFNDFSHFRRYRNSERIFSENLNSSLSFLRQVVFNSTETGFATDIYVLTFDDNGSCMDFNFAIDFSGSFQNSFNAFYIKFGYYKNQYQTQTFLSFKIESDNLGSQFKGSISVYNPRSIDTYEVGSFNKNEPVEISFQRISTFVQISIRSSSSPTQTASITTVHSTKLNYFLLEKMDLSRNFYNITLSDPNISLWVDNSPLGYNPLFPVNTFTTTFIIIFFVIVFALLFSIIGLYFLITHLKRVAKRKDEILRDPAIVDYRRPLSEDFLQSSVPPDMSKQITEKIDSRVSEMFNNDIRIFDGPQGSTTCMICRTNINPGDEILQCPKCQHSFHKLHYIKWVSAKNKCPICKEVAVKPK